MNNSVEDKELIDKIILYSEIYKNCINLFVNTNNINNYNEIEIRNNLYYDIFNNINKIFNTINNNYKSKNNKHLEYFKKILSVLLSKQYDFNNEIYSYLLSLIVKNIDKKKTIINILNNINSTEFDENYNNMSYIKTNLVN